MGMEMEMEMEAEASGHHHDSAKKDPQRWVYWNLWYLWLEIVKTMCGYFCKVCHFLSIGERILSGCDSSPDFLTFWTERSLDKYLWFSKILLCNSHYFLGDIRS